MFVQHICDGVFWQGNVGGSVWHQLPSGKPSPPSYELNICIEQLLCLRQGCVCGRQSGFVVHLRKLQRKVVQCGAANGSSHLGHMWDSHHTLGRCTLNVVDLCAKSQPWSCRLFFVQISIQSHIHMGICHVPYC